VLVHPSIPARSVGELIELAKKEPGKLNYASAGVGSGIHLGWILFEMSRREAHPRPLPGEPARR
jgi:tripartite-type tricarboxylate transporter receptor subunit TctC